jgi:Ni,Fe-hydrogenase III large subunit
VRLALVAAHEDAGGLRVVHAFLRPVGQCTEFIVEVPRDDAWVPTLAGVSFPAGRTLARVEVVDPSFFNWPALPVALADTIVPDFPLANKSFNQSYAGNDL